MTEDEFLPDAWARRDLPVLREAARIIDSDPSLVGPRLHEIASATGLSDTDVVLAARALEDAGLVELRLVSPISHGRISRISAEARQLVGLWPSESTMLKRMTAALEAIAANTSDPDAQPAAAALEALNSAGELFGRVTRAGITGKIS